MKGLFTRRNRQKIKCGTLNRFLTSVSLNCCENQSFIKLFVLQQMSQYQENFPEEAKEFQLAMKKKATQSGKSSSKLKNSVDLDEGSNRDEQAKSDQEGYEVECDHDSVNQGAVDKLLIDVKSNRLLTTSSLHSKRSSSQREYTSSPLFTKANKKSKSFNHTPPRPQVLYRPHFCSCSIFCPYCIIDM